MLLLCIRASFWSLDIAITPWRVTKKFQLTMINDIKVKKLTIMSYFQQTCQYFDKDVKKMTLFIAEIAQKLTKKSEKIYLLLGNLC